MHIATHEVVEEARRLYEKLQRLGWHMEDCEQIAPTTLQINRLKQEQDAVVLAHSYQTPDIMYGVGDFIGDSYALSRKAMDHPARKIVFCSVYFMGETAKLLNPDKEVLVPLVAACSLADSISASAATLPLGISCAVLQVGSSHPRHFTRYSHPPKHAGALRAARICS